MKILLAAATEAEIQPFITYLQQRWISVSGGVFRGQGQEVHIIITGAGMAATAYSVTKALLRGQFDLAIQAGIGGSFDREIGLGEVVFVRSDRYGDMGAEDKENYIDIFDLGFADRDAYPFSGGVLLNEKAKIHEKTGLKEVSGLTVNMVTGKQETIDRLGREYGCQVESMEGAAFHYACLMEKVPFAQIRAISNYIEPRDRDKWHIGTAIANLNKWLIDFLQKL